MEKESEGVGRSRGAEAARAVSCYCLVSSLGFGIALKFDPSCFLLSYGNTTKWF